MFLGQLPVEGPRPRTEETKSWDWIRALVAMILRMATRLLDQLLVLVAGPGTEGPKSLDRHPA